MILDAVPPLFSRNPTGGDMPKKQPRPIQIPIHPSAFSIKAVFVEEVVKAAKDLAEKAWDDWERTSRRKRGRPTERTRIEEALASLVNEHFGIIAEGRLVRSARNALESQNRRDGTMSPPHEDTIKKYAKEDRLLNRTDPKKLTIQQAQWLAKHSPAQAQELLRMAQLFPDFSFPKKIQRALSAQHPPKK